MSLLEFTGNGIYCPAADVYLDPWKPVAKALITHGHSDHASWGHGSYLCTTSAAPVIKHRLNLSGNIQTADYGKPVSINGVEFSFHPAGHIPGSAQIRVAHKGEVWVFSGDYKLENDGISEPFEPVKCQYFYYRIHVRATCLQMEAPAGSVRRHQPVVAKKSGSG